MTGRNEIHAKGPNEASSHRLSSTLELLVRLLGVVNGTITIHARGGKVSRGIEIVSKVDVFTVE